jgi:hypothetical protein
MEWAWIRCSIRPSRRHGPGLFPAPVVDVILDVSIRLKLFHGMAVEGHQGLNPSTAPEVFTRAGFSLVRWKRFQLGLNNLFVFRKSPGIDGRNGERRPAHAAG